MRLERGRISSCQLLLLIWSFIEGSAPLIGFITPIARQDAWLAVLAAAAVMAPFMYLYALLASKFAGLNLVQISHCVYGPVGGAMASILYIFCFFMTLSFNLRDLGVLYATHFMLDTPQIVFVIIFTAACAAAVSGGIEILARLSLVFVLITTSVILGTSLLLMGNMDFSHFLPIFEVPIKDFIHSTQIMTVIPFAETLVFLMIAAQTGDRRNITGAMLLALVCGAASLLVVTVRNTAVLGPAQTIMESPAFEAARLIDVAKVLTRMDILIGIGQSVALFLKCSVLYYVAVLALAELLRLRTYLPLVIPFGMIVANLAHFVYPTEVDHLATTVNTCVIFPVPILFVLPVLTLLVAKIRNLPLAGGKGPGPAILRAKMRELRAVIRQARSAECELRQGRDKLQQKGGAPVTGGKASHET